MKSSIQLTIELEARIVASIRAGGYPAMAAQAWGVPERLFQRWLSLGRRRKASEKYRSFALKVDQAQAHARLKAEMDVFDRDPKCWLRHGPGKEQPGKPGWSAPVKPVVAVVHESTSLFANVELLRLLAGIRTALAPYPEALRSINLLLDQSTQARE